MLTVCIISSFFLISIVAPSKDLPKVLAKYTYTANPERPGGFDELGMKQGEKLYFHFQHKSNPHWLFAENMNGVTGYVPASYIMVSLNSFANKKSKQKPLFVNIFSGVDRERQWVVAPPPQSFLEAICRKIVAFVGIYPIGDEHFLCFWNPQTLDKISHWNFAGKMPIPKAWVKTHRYESYHMTIPFLGKFWALPVY